MQIGIYALDKGSFSSTCHSYCYNRYWLFDFFHGTRHGSGVGNCDRIALYSY